MHGRAQAWFKKPWACPRQVDKTLGAPKLVSRNFGHTQRWVEKGEAQASMVVDAIDTYYRRYLNAPCRIASAAFDSLSFRKRDAHVQFMRRDAAFQGGVMSGEPPVRPSVRLRPIALPHCHIRSFVQHLFRVRPRPTIRPFVQNLRLRLHPERRPPSLRTPFHFIPFRPVARTGTYYAIKLGTTADHFGHVLLASTYKNLA
ncbi:hypothetical protein K438DRAFT_1981628 [Mycena galopus ATCC 62051]|nr:hypothetical protein K438DRAFT_1981628 [Mycena galopus ATCC 62051]